MLWLKLGKTELINLEHARSIKKGPNSTIEIVMDSVSGKRILPFADDQARDEAFEKLLENLIRLKKALE